MFDLKKEYTKMMADKILVISEDLTDNELVIIESGFTILEEKLEEIKLLKDEIKRLSIELSNLKIYMKDLQKDNWEYPRT